jgi:hypothetical protein
VARFELLQELQGHGLSLSAIERFFESIPADATPEQIALHRTTLRPLASAEPTIVGRRDLEKRAGRRLTDHDLAHLQALGGVGSAEDGKYALNEGRMRAALTVIDRGIPIDIALACEEIYRRHSTAMAAELEALFRESLWPAYKSGELSADQLVTMLDNWEQAGMASIVEAFREAITETRRTIIARRAGTDAASA